MVSIMTAACTSQNIALYQWHILLMWDRCASTLSEHVLLLFNLLICVFDICQLSAKY